eukprot:CAMPEP_0198573470 /NCGR_PEP_ID=MMETSP1462-20131121/113271_1 /TAXON_ID=1333877 /ORGANISM="Brandtodinium nutriculum, Strain RCC3387" /LENGTH=115 /DNA_ID=CAMNT_0044304657 /DNA_START=276 /DNA_END=620 /DNA_ORIENTATION=+
MTDCDEKLRHWMPFIRALNKSLTAWPTAWDMTTWRYSKKLTDDAVESVFKGKTYRLGMYVATSLDRDAARDFGAPGCWHVRFHIPKGCYNATDISSSSNFGKEYEVLLPPYTAVQ